MKWRVFLVVAVTAVVAACSTGLQDRVVDACLDGVAQRLVDRAAEPKP